MPLINDYTEVAKLVTETMKRDDIIFEIWPEFTASKEKLLSFEPDSPKHENDSDRFSKMALRDLIEKGSNLINFIAEARVPMPKSQADFFEVCDRIIDLNR